MTSDTSNAPRDVQQGWEEKVAAKRKQRQESIPQEWLIPPIADHGANVLKAPETSGVLTQKELEITVTDPSLLLEKLAQGVLTSVEVTVAFCKRAAIAHQLVSRLLNDSSHLAHHAI